MSDTKEKILHESLRLFARNGYEAVSCSDIAGALGITKGALYRHYKSKRDIFGSILAEMERRDAVRAAAFDLPEGTLSDMPEKYRTASADKLTDFCKAQFDYWTADGFASDFRRMLTVEQFRDVKMAALYRQYLSGGPLGYVATCSHRWVSPVRRKRRGSYMRICFSVTAFTMGKMIRKACAVRFSRGLTK